MPGWPFNGGDSYDGESEFNYWLDYASGPRTDQHPHPCIQEKEQEIPTWVDPDVAQYPTPAETEWSSMLSDKYALSGESKAGSKVSTGVIRRILVVYWVNLRDIRRICIV